MNSIRLFLIASTVATLILYNFVATLRGYRSSMSEADALFDNQLLEFSQLVAHLETSRIDTDFHLGNNLAFQVWESNQVLAASYQAPAQPMNDFSPGFEFANFGGYRWRTFTRFDESSGHWIIVAERTDLRFMLAENVVLESIAPVLLGIPIAGLLIWILFGIGLRPLHQLSLELRLKRAQDLRAIQLKHTPRELNQVVQSINGLLQRLNEALDRERQFSADAAHELRTPISALKIQLHNLAQETDSGSETFGQLKEGVERIQHLVEQLLALYRGSMGQSVEDYAKVNLFAIAQDVAARHYPLIEQKRQTLELEGDAAYINGDTFALETMVANLLSNASKYTPEGGHVLMRLVRKGRNICLVVEDSGPGIALSEREHIFKRFYRGSSASNAGVMGCGLGLAIVSHFAAAHAATVSVEASSLGGAAFCVCFPEMANAP